MCANGESAAMLHRGSLWNEGDSLRRVKKNRAIARRESGAQYSRFVAFFLLPRLNGGS